MKQFNLEEYLANPLRKVVTRDGKNIRIICTDCHDDYPIIALLSGKDGSESIFQYTKHGTIFNDQSDEFDLFFASEKKEGWVNIYKNERDHYFGKFIYPKKTDAKAVADSTCIATVKIEWEE